MTTTTKYNWEILSLARFLLAFIVLTNHLEAFTNTGVLHWYGNFGSFEAILGFLLISGFSIGKSIKKNKESYFKRRISRIYPVYIASLILVYFVFPPQFSFNWLIILLINLAFLNQVLVATSKVGPAWSLALEVWLYALAPLFLKATYKILLGLIVFSFVCYCLYTLGRTRFHWPYYAGTKYGINLLVLSFIWIAGFALATQVDYSKIFTKVIAAIFILHIVLVVSIQLLSKIKHHNLADFLSHDVIGFVMQSACLVGVYYAVVLNHVFRQPSLFVKKIFHLLGNISYPLYLIHATVFYQLKKMNILNVPLMIAIVMVSAYLIYVVFDFYSRRRAIA